MRVQRHFLGWDRPVTERVRDFLVPAASDGPADLGDTLVVVPTRQAGRRLREALVREGPGRQHGILSLRTVLPAHLLAAPIAGRPVASPAFERAVWMDLLAAAGPEEYAALLPGDAEGRDPTWALGAARLIQRLRHDLADGAQTVAGVLDGRRSDLEEPDRWACLARLESRYLDRLERLGLADDCARRLRAAEQPRLEDGVRRVILAAVPDPSPLVLAALGHLAGRADIHVLVHAPPELAGAFDDWGRPRPEAWRNAVIDVPDPDRNILLAASPEDQARRVIDLLAAEAPRHGLASVAIGVPDATVIPPLRDAFARGGLAARDPADRPVLRHPLGQLVAGFARLAAADDYPTLRLLLRHPDVLGWLGAAAGASAYVLLEALDTGQNRTLPAGWPESASADEPLARALAPLRAAVAAARRGPLSAALREVLLAAYADRRLVQANPADREFESVAAEITAILDELADLERRLPRLDLRTLVPLLLDRLADAASAPEHAPADLDLEGWLELPWNDAPLLVVTGLNEGIVPDGILADVFLPDQLRATLGLRDDAQRLARDAFLLRTLIEPRRAGGRAVLLAGRTGADREPLKPSRLLFRCPDDQLVARAGRLFDDALAGAEEAAPAARAIRLDAAPPPDLPPGRLDPARIHVTALRAYLACPFRYYLGHVLEMAGLDDLKAEPDAMDFGLLVHEALRGLFDRPALRASADAERIAKELAGRAEDWVRDRFGGEPPLSVVLALHSARQRLRKAAAVQARLAAEGWEIVRGEEPLAVAFDGVTLCGRVDRVDRHRETGRLRIIDYKTSDRAVTPAAAHLAADRRDDPRAFDRILIDGKDWRWIDLQLPLYRVLLRAEESAAAPELAYFNLPKAVQGVGLEPWAEITDRLVASAEQCAREVVRRIRRGVFWPPAERAEYDDFAFLLGPEPENYIDGKPTGDRAATAATAAAAVNPKSESRNPKQTRNPKSETRNRPDAK